MFDYLWKDISDGEVPTQLGPKSVGGDPGCSQPLRVTVIWDASESGGGSVYGSKR